ncbi:MAG: pyruvate carboxylase [Clostridiales Family XIII bacterium]|jgi:pyruvate carboxylase|nr:pyruvate carboxylase [Clostridiales Family XIII bacterium]
MKSMNFTKVMAANRGEIAVRIFRACFDLGMRTVAIYSKEDEFSSFRTKADESYKIGEALSPLGVYLDIPLIIATATKYRVEAIHPGYGFLSENAEFAYACEQAGIKFIGPPSSVLRRMGDKLEAKKIADQCGVRTIPGSKKPLESATEAADLAQSYGFPIILKASAGGGGRGMRRCNNVKEVLENFPLVKNEAEKSFGNGDIFIERYIEEPKHIEVQILADEHGNVVHLFERDCSLQRRYQKVVEFTPAWSLPEELRAQMCEDAVKIAKAVNYVSAGTVEFIVDKSSEYFFIEMNPRIQVEHTVSEMVTGIDIVRAQLLIAQGLPLSIPQIGISSQEDVHLNGYAIQCRITTEDPQNNFAPDTGRITSYRSAGGFGVRLDGGNAYAGAEILPYYDSLLVKVTVHDNTFPGCAAKAFRAVNETSVRGLKTNIGFLGNILKHKQFLEGKCHTRFIDETPELFIVTETGDRATRLMKYIGKIIVNEPMSGRIFYEAPRLPKTDGKKPLGLKHLLDTEGPEAVRDRVLSQKKLLIGDTTMRDAHQSLLATRLRTRDMVRVADATGDILADAFSLEMWGGATFDVAYRFLYETPWDRLDELREKIPNILFQMLLRGANAVGYTNYPDNLIREFIQEAARSGIDVFRVFDSLNWIPGTEIAIDEVLKTGKIAEAAICYTGDVSDPNETKWTVDYYLNLAKKFEAMGVHIIAIKDMAGLMKPYAAKKLFEAFKQELKVPIRLHTHDTTGNQIATLMMAAEAGVDIVDTAISSFSSLTSQPSMNSIVTALQGSERDTGFDPARLEELSEYWADVRERYWAFEGGIKYPTTDIYRYEIPGGQYTNLQPQVESLGLGHRFNEIKEMYKTVNDMLGGLVKVTPSSKMVGDLAIFMVQNDLTPDTVVERGASLSFPDSVVSYFKGMMGQPSWGFPEDLQKVVLKGETPITVRPGELLEPVDFDKTYAYLTTIMKNPTKRSVISYCFYPKVVEDYLKIHREYGYLTKLGSHVFFHGLAPGETHRVEIEDGKTLVLKFTGTGELDEEGRRAVMFELNGSQRTVFVRDEHAESDANQIVMADPADPNHISASIPGIVSHIGVKVGDKVKTNDVLLIVEAMKMEVSVTANTDGTIEEILVGNGEKVLPGALLIRLS